MKRWVTVTPLPGKTILGGPHLWDGVALWQPPEGGGRQASAMVDSGELLEETPALAAGYVWPPPPDDPYVQVDDQTMTITGGPYMWNGVGTPPESGTLMLQWQAESSGYTWP